jgi:hypothetical protein
MKIMNLRVHEVLTTLAIVVTALASLASLSAAVRFTSTFKSIDAGSVSFAGKKVAAVVITDDDSLRMAGEESLARELTARGMQAVASYRMAPKEELRRAETAKVWFERAGVDGVVALRPVSVDTRQPYTTAMWLSPNYATFWGYYGYGWSNVYVIGTVQAETVVAVESMIYSVSRNQLMWAAVTETTNPRSLPGFVGELVKESVKEMQEQGLAKSQPR